MYRVLFLYTASLIQHKDCKKILPAMIYNKGARLYNKLETSHFISLGLFQKLLYVTTINYDMTQFLITLDFVLPKKTVAFPWV